MHPDGGTMLGNIKELEDKDVSENGKQFQMKLQKRQGLVHYGNGQETNAGGLETL